jgi:hypothetical protein
MRITWLFYSLAAALLPHAAAAGDVPVSVTGIAGATSDYVYRGVSQRDGRPTPLAYLSLKWGALYADSFLVGVALGEDALGRGIGTLESDVTVGLTPKWKNVEFNFGAKYTAYPNGRDIVVGTLDRAERDFIEPFAGVTVALDKALSLGGMAYWTPDFYYRTGEVTTLEGKATLALPPLGALNTKLTAFAGAVRSERENVVSPGTGYQYYNVGIEGQLDHLVFDLRYWGTDVDGFSAFNERLVLSAGVSF